MPIEEQKEEKISSELKCKKCGAVLAYEPGTTVLKCIYCGVENEIEQTATVIEEIDYEKFIREKFALEEKVDVASVRCQSCGASITLAPNVTADRCPYCASHIVIQGASTSKMVKPKALIPFKIDKSKAQQSFFQWINSRWFAPSDLKKSAQGGKIEGIYIPYWTYNTDTDSEYDGKRGIYHYRTETYTTTENGRTVTRTRQVRYTVWTPVAGQVASTFKNVLVIASQSLPVKYTEKLEPWSIEELVTFDDKYLGGFRSESYQVNVETGFTTAKQKMEPVIMSNIRSHIGGDEQQIDWVKTDYRDITFKHVLLPLWISSYRYRDKAFRFLINGQTGEVQGERPYSAFKIVAFVLSIILIIVLIIVLLSK